MTTRCAWARPDDPLMVAYHDHEWGVPVHDDRQLFELLVLEGAQAGLSWATVLRKRDGYRRAFANFDVETVAHFTERRIETLLGNPGIIRNRLKVTSTVRNARAILEIQQEFGSFDAYCWRFAGGHPRVNRWRRREQVPASTPESDAFSKELKRRGFGFVGSTIIYSFMQATGMVNDHLLSCFRFRELTSG